jgi:aquaporin Z
LSDSTLIRTLHPAAIIHDYSIQGAFGMTLVKRCAAEFLGTFWLVFGGCGSAVLAAAYTANTPKIGENTSFPLGISLVDVSLVFGLTGLTMAFARF